MYVHMHVCVFGAVAGMAVVAVVGALAVASTGATLAGDS